MGCTHSKQFTRSEIEPLKVNKKIIAICGTRAVGKSTILKSIGGRSINHKTANQIMKSIRRECIGNILYSYHQTIKSLTSDNDKKHFKQKTFTSIAFIRCNIHKIDEEHRAIAHHIRYLWSLPQIKHTFYTHLATDGNNDYFLQNVTNFMNPEHILTANEYLRIYHNPSTTTQTNEYYNDYTIYELHDTQNISHKVDTECIVCVIALNHFCIKYNKNGAQINKLWESLQLFNDIYSNMMAHKTPKQLMLVLNKVDLFRKYLKYRPFKEIEQMFGDAYDGRNYSDKLPDILFVNKILDILVKGSNVILPRDIKNLMGKFCGDFFSECWLDLCCRDAIDYIQKQFLHSKENVHCFAICATNTAQVEHILSTIPIY